MDWPRCEQQALGCPKCNRFPTGLSHRRHKQGNSLGSRLLCHLPRRWYSLLIQRHEQWNQSMKQSRCTHFFVWKRIHPSLEWNSYNNLSNNEISCVLSWRIWNDCLILNGKVDGATLSHANQDGWEKVTLTAPVRQFYCCWYDQLYINYAQVEIVGLTPQLVTLQRGSRTIPY